MNAFPRPSWALARVPGGHPCPNTDWVTGSASTRLTVDEKESVVAEQHQIRGYSSGVCFHIKCDGKVLGFTIILEDSVNA